MQLQYIGARYVPIWYKNSVDDSANWEVNVEYEPLTFVTSQNNHLYLSKKQVPDNIGTPAQNTEYWLDMGAFTGGSYEEIQEEIDDINDVKIPAIQNQIDTIVNTTIPGISEDINNLESTVNLNAVKTGIGNAVFIGDSYCTISTGYTKALPELLKDTMEFEKIYNYAIPGSGYVNGNATLQNFAGQLSNALNNLTQDERDKVSYVFVLGGQNDYAQSASAIYTECNTLLGRIRENFSNAKVVVLPLWRNEALSEANAVRFPIIYYLAMMHGCISDSKSWSYLINVYTGTMTDGVHPTQASLNFLAESIKTLLHGGNPTMPASGGILTCNKNLGTWYTPSAFFDGETVTINGLLSVSGNHGANTELLHVNPAYKPAISPYVYILKNNGTALQCTFASTSGALLVNGALNNGDIVKVQITYSLFAATGAIGDPVQ